MFKPYLDGHCLHVTDVFTGAERFSSKPREGRLQEIEALREFLIATVKLLDDRTAQITAPKERLMTLLTSKDKKAAIMEMAGMMCNFACPCWWLDTNGNAEVTCQDAWEPRLRLMRI